MVFIPLVVETLGGWEEQDDVQIKRLGAALARQLILHILSKQKFDLYVFKVREL